MKQNNQNNHNNIEKEKIFYSRTYRYLSANKIESILYLLILVLPCLILLLLNYGKLSVLVSDITARILELMVPGIEINYSTVEFIPFLEKIKIVVLPTKLPTFTFTTVNICISFLLLLFSRYRKINNNPLGIFLGIMIFIHIINCTYFLFASEVFPYTAKDYSKLYMQQQIGIWISFLIIIGFVISILGYKKLFLRIITFFGVMIYSFLFGLLRYILVLYVVYKFSLLYVAIFFFALGPFFDFLYLVSLYAFFVNKMIDVYDGEKERGQWKWS